MDQASEDVRWEGTEEKFSKEVKDHILLLVRTSTDNKQKGHVPGKHFVQMLELLDSNGLTSTLDPELQQVLELLKRGMEDAKKTAKRKDENDSEYRWRFVQYQFKKVQDLKEQYARLERVAPRSGMDKFMVTVSKGHILTCVNNLRFHHDASGADGHWDSKPKTTIRERIGKFSNDDSPEAVEARMEIYKVAAEFGVVVSVP